MEQIGFADFGLVNRTHGANRAIRVGWSNRLHEEKSRIERGRLHRRIEIFQAGEWLRAISVPERFLPATVTVRVPYDTMYQNLQ